jgi:hypothetical protein
MLAKCANALCSTPFRRLSEGKLFLLEGEGMPNREPADPQKAKPPRRVEYFWLCNDCARLVTLTFSSTTGVTTVPLSAMDSAAAMQGSTHPVIEPQREAGMLAHSSGYQRG